MKNPHTRQKVKKYGEIRTIPYGTASNILVPIKPTMGWREYDFEDDESLDYTGSYHITITLPCRENIQIMNLLNYIRILLINFNG